ncbi:MAG: ExbD/TolR family protein [Calothrix sp. SM1_5_4]|nr:ExbD/TolR family protein [Calothrix sp. SM1_5_4]
MAASSPKSGGSRMVLSEINVTPLVDVMLVLLIIFMVTAPMMQQGLEVQLPETANSGVSTSDEPFILVIKKDKSIHAGTSRLALESLDKKLKAIFSTRKNKQIYLQADRAVDYGTVAEVMGEIRAAGIYNIGLITVPKDGSK